jgi:hypothetical protein
MRDNNWKIGLGQYNLASDLPIVQRESNDSTRKVYGLVRCSISSAYICFITIGLKGNTERSLAS